MLNRIVDTLKRVFIGPAGSSASQLSVGFLIERVWEHARGWIKDNPRQAAHALSYLAQAVSKNPTPQTLDIFIDAQTELDRIDPSGNLSSRLASRLQTLMGGTPDPGDRMLNRAQKLFAVIVTHLPEDVETLGDLDERQAYVESTARRLEMYARMDGPTWEAWRDVMNFDAPDREHWFSRLREFLGESDSVENALAWFSAEWAEIHPALDEAEVQLDSWRASADVRLAGARRIPKTPFGWLNRFGAP